jgi:hypothetical protein
MEQEISDRRYNANTGNVERPSHWLGLRRKISRHFGKRRKRGDAFGEDGDVHGNHGREEEKQIGNSAGRERGGNDWLRERHHQEKNAEGRARESDRITSNERNEIGDIHQGIWRRAGCRCGD